MDKAQAFQAYVERDYGKAIAAQVAEAKLDPMSPDFESEALAALHTVVCANSKNSTYCGPTTSRIRIEDVI